MLRCAKDMLHYTLHAFHSIGYGLVMKCMSSQMLFVISSHNHFTKYSNLPMPLQYLICATPHNFGPLFMMCVLAVAGVSGLKFGSAKLNLSFKLWTKTGCVIFKVLLCQSILIFVPIYSFISPISLQSTVSVNFFLVLSMVSSTQTINMSSIKDNQTINPNVSSHL